MTRVAVSGHRGLSPDVVTLITKGIAAELKSIIAAGDTNLIGLSCLADGADQIFAEAVLACGGSIEAIVPAEQYREGLPDSEKPRYDALMSHASAVHQCQHRESTSESHMDASRVMVDGADRLIAVWDGQPSRSYGGTADVVDYARQKGLPVSIIWPEGAHRD